MTIDLIIEAYQKLQEYTESLCNEISRIIPNEQNLIADLSLCISNIHLHLSLDNIEYVNVDIYKELATSFSGNKYDQLVSFYTQEKFEGEATLITDPNILQELFTIPYCLPLFRIVPIQIANNAKKYMPKGSELSVTLISKNNNTYIWFSNMGPYCTEEDIEHIFEEGFRGEQSNITAGLGIGLSEIKKIVDLHKWHNMLCDVTIDNNIKQPISGSIYSLFRIELFYSKINKDFDKPTIEEINDSSKIILIHDSYDITDKLFRICNELRSINECRIESYKMNIEINLFLDRIKYCQYLYFKKQDISCLLGNERRIDIDRVFKVVVNNLKRFYFPHLKSPSIIGKLKPIDTYSCMYSILTGLLYNIFSCYDAKDDIYIGLEEDTIVMDGFECNIQSKLKGIIEDDKLDMYKKLLSELNCEISFSNNILNIIF